MSPPLQTAFPDDVPPSPQPSAASRCSCSDVAVAADDDVVIDDAVELRSVLDRVRLWK